MAFTYDTSAWDTPVSKRPSMQAALVSKLKMFTVKATFGASDDYATNGVAIDVKQDKINTVIAAVPIYNTVGAVAEYIVSTGKVRLYGTKTSGTVTPADSLAELPNGSQDTRSKVIEFLVFGY